MLQPKNLNLHAQEASLLSTIQKGQIFHFQAPPGALKIEFFFYDTDKQKPVFMAESRFDRELTRICLKSEKTRENFCRDQIERQIAANQTQKRTAIQNNWSPNYQMPKILWRFSSFGITGSPL
ncbi:MAG: hypothetical protein VX768_02700 [Planctomycetota bacterium]|nr:hypothetical protein [Planctomycetota bacterium]